jgi:hypothetical protein
MKIAWALASRGSGARAGRSGCRSGSGRSARRARRCRDTLLRHPFERDDGISAGGCHADSVRGDGLSVTRIIVATWRCGIGRIPVHQRTHSVAVYQATPQGACPIYQSARSGSAIRPLAWHQPRLKSLGRTAHHKRPSPRSRSSLSVDLWEDQTLDSAPSVRHSILKPYINYFMPINYIHNYFYNYFSTNSRLFVLYSGFRNARRARQLADVRPGTRHRQEVARADAD